MTEGQELNEHVNTDSLKALETLKAIGLLQTVDGSVVNAQLISSWGGEVQFDIDGNVIVIDLGGKRLYKGLPCAPEMLNPARFPFLTKLNLAGTDLPFGDLMAVLDQVQAHIEHVYLGGNGLGVEGSMKLATSWLASARKLLTLDLRYNDIKGVGMEAICQALASTQVQYLYVEGNQIGDSGAMAVAALLKDPKSPLEQLFMGANQILAPGAQALASTLYVNKKISKIYLEGNSIGLDGANYFSSALEDLKGDTGLKNLFVDNNNIGKEGSLRLAKALNSATVIEDAII